MFSNRKTHILKCRHIIKQSCVLKENSKPLTKINDLVCSHFRQIISKNFHVTGGWSEQAENVLKKYALSCSAVTDQNCERAFWNIQVDAIENVILVIERLFDIDDSYRCIFTH